MDSPNQGRNRIISGVEGLDTIIEGGFAEKSVILLAGMMGRGKTIILET